jgi:hypothetical protein
MRKGISLNFPPFAYLPDESADWVVGVMDNARDAERSREAARNAGFKDDELWIAHGQEALDTARLRDSRRGLPAKFYATLARAITDAGEMENEYLGAASDGHSLVGIRTVTSERIPRAHDLLRFHRGRRIRYLGHWFHQDLSGC